MCRLPLNWNGILQLCEGDQYDDIEGDVIGEVVDADEEPPRREMNRNNNANANVRDVRRRRIVRLTQLNLFHC